MPAIASKLVAYEKVFERHLQDLARLDRQPDLHTTPDFMKDLVVESDPTLRQRIEAEFFGNGPLTNLLEDNEITEIMLNGPDKISFDRLGVLYTHEDRFASRKTYQNFIDRFAFENRVNTNFKKPMANGRWGQWRFHLIVPPLVAVPALTLRRHRKTAFTLGELQETNWAPQKAIETLASWVNEQRNLLIVGPTNAGKTSVLGALLRETSPTQRVVIIEDTDELHCPNSHSLKLFTREKIEDSLPAVSLAELVTESLRMRPDRIVLGEMRGGEAKDYLLALSTGHGGSMATLHASDPHQALIRLEFLIQMGAPVWSVAAIRQLIRASLYGIVTLENINGARRLKGLYRLASLESTGFCLDTVYQTVTSK